MKYSVCLEVPGARYRRLFALILIILVPGCIPRAFAVAGNHQSRMLTRSTFIQSYNTAKVLRGSMALGQVTARGHITAAVILTCNNPIGGIAGT